MKSRKGGSKATAGSLGFQPAEPARRTAQSQRISPKAALEGVPTCSVDARGCQAHIPFLGGFEMVFRGHPIVKYLKRHQEEPSVLTLLHPLSASSPIGGDRRIDIPMHLH